MARQPRIDPADIPQHLILCNGVRVHFRSARGRAEMYSDPKIIPRYRHVFASASLNS